MSALDDIAAEVARQAEIGNAAEDATRSINDWIAFITAYAGRAAQDCYRNEREGCDARTMLVKVGALAVSAVDAIDRKPLG